MSQRSIGLIGGIIFLLSLVGIQAFRLSTKADLTLAIVEGALMGAFIVLLVAGAFLGQYLLSKSRWRRAEQAAPSAQHELLLVGQDLWIEGVLSGKKVALYLGPDTLEVWSMASGPAQLWSSPVALIESARVEQHDSAMSWSTFLDVRTRDGRAISIALEGWRIRSRKKLFDIASRAAGRINEGL